MLSSLDITRVVAESANTLVGSRISSVEFYRKERALQVYFKGIKNYCLTYSFHPSRSMFCVLPASKSRLETPEKYRPFAREIIDCEARSLRQVTNDRIVEMDIKHDCMRYILLFEIIGPNGNVWLLEGDYKIAASLRNKQFDANKPYSPVPLPEKLDPVRLKAADLKTLFEKNPGVNPARLLEKNVYGFDYPLARAVLDLSGYDEPGGIDSDKVEAGIAEVVSRYHNGDSSIYAYRLGGKIVFYPLKLARQESLGKFRSLSEAQLEIMKQIRDELDEEDLREKSLRAIRGKIKKVERLILKLDQDIQEASNYEHYLQMADLLKVNLLRLRRGMKTIEVENLFQAGVPQVIQLDPKLTGQENIEFYARKFRKGKEGLAILSRRRQNSKLELERLHAALADFEDDLNRARQKYPELVLTKPGSSSSAAATAVLPYKEYQTSTGVTILVGKSGENNDRTTFQYARPYDLWFHASQCPGSHVVLKYPDKNFQPSKLEIAEAAAAAAYFSKSRGAAKVPISYTLKKYVRKPRKAKPGLVLIEREKSILAEPKEPVKK